MDFNFLFKPRLFFKLPILVAIIVVVFFEWIEYSLYPSMTWPKLASRFSDSVKILVVGDPQLLGYRFSAPNIIGFIYRWDADRYVKKTFSIAYNYVNPDVTIFLGDNFDEGEIATDREFIDYFQRFKYIFQEVDFNKAIIVPGDNDIGGESQPPQLYLEKRFHKYFRNDVFMQYKFLEFVKVNYITHSNKYQIAKNISQNSFRIILSHLPLTPSYSSFISQVIPYVQPHIILSAHDHKSEHVISDRKTGIIIQTPSTSHFTSCSFNISDTFIHEIIAPTCSYRMGTHKMGYGALEISKTGETTYSVLWSPPRFRQIWIFLFVLCCVLLYVIALCSRTFLRHKYIDYRRPKSFNSNW